MPAGKMRRRAIALGPHDLADVTRGDGTILIRAVEPLGAYPRALPDRLVHWAAHRPDTTFLAERSRDGAGWRTIGYAETLVAVRAIAQGLIDRGAGATHGVALLAPNGIDHALVALAAQYAGIPYAPISPAYALLSRDFGTLRYCLSLFDPALVVVDDPRRFARALASDALAGRATTILAPLRATEPTAAVDAAYAALTPDTVAKILFTSGSTGQPKGVINTQRMQCANQQMALQAMPFWADPHVLLDWVPWNHTAGSNQTFNMVLYNGGTMYIDDGKPAAGEFAKTVRNLHEISPTLVFNVPRGFDELARALTADPALCRTFFRRLQMMWYAGAALSAPIFERMQQLARETTGEDILMTSSLGATETAPSALFANFFDGGCGNVGVPLPGVEMKLAPVGAKLELRVRGPSITPGYLGRDDLTAAAFDEDGYYRTGDAVRPLDAGDFSRGFLFDGRLGDDFKLSTGTWVSVGTLRTEIVAALQPLVRDVVICGADRDDLGMLMLGDEDVARPSGGAGAGAGATPFAHPAVRAFVADRLAAYARAHPGSSRHIVRALFFPDAPSIDAGEITDKGSLNNAAVRSRRAPLIERLFIAGDPQVITPSS
jgi:feruloyl-CoA synthase